MHKSEDSSLNQILYHKQELVYVALSRVTSLESIFHTNATKTFKFYHVYDLLRHLGKS